MRKSTQLEALLKSLNENITAEVAKSNVDARLVNTRKSEVEALVLVHDELAESAVLAASIAKTAQELTGAEKPEPVTLETIMQVSSLRSVYLPLAYRRLIASGAIVETAVGGVNAALAGLGGEGLNDN
jgi:uncharacterized phage infection (PIP) family protein YhgE